MDNNVMALVVSIALGVGLSAACGLRIFLPLCLAGLAAAAGWYHPNPEFAWLSSLPALITLGVATAVEIAAYYIPWLDNLLDHLGLPLAAAAGTLLAATAIDINANPVLLWSLAAIAGGLPAALLHAGTGALRAVSSAATLGCGNSLLATLEWVLSIVVSVLALFAPLVAAALAIVLMVLAVRALTRRKTRQVESSGG